MLLFPLTALSAPRRSLDLSGISGLGTVSQVLSTAPGTKYNVSFDLAGNFSGAPSLKEIRVSAAGQFADFSFDASSTNALNMGWVTEEWTFTAIDASTTLMLSSLTAGGFLR